MTLGLTSKLCGEVPLNRKKLYTINYDGTEVLTRLCVCVYIKVVVDELVKKNDGKPVIG